MAPVRPLHMHAQPGLPYERLAARGASMLGRVVEPDVG